MKTAPEFTGRHPTDKELDALLPTLSLRDRIEAILAKYVGGAMSRHYDGKTNGLKADRQIAEELTRKIARWLPQEPASVDRVELPVDLVRELLAIAEAHAEEYPTARDTADRLARAIPHV